MLATTSLQNKIIHVHQDRLQARLTKKQQSSTIVFVFVVVCHRAVVNVYGSGESAFGHKALQALQSDRHRRWSAWYSWC